MCLNGPLPRPACYGQRESLAIWLAHGGNERIWPSISEGQPIGDRVTCASFAIPKAARTPRPQSACRFARGLFCRRVGHELATVCERPPRRRAKHSDFLPRHTTISCPSRSRRILLQVILAPLSLAVRASVAFWPHGQIFPAASQHVGRAQARRCLRDGFAVHGLQWCRR